MQKIIRIGTRASELALFQANKVRKELAELGHESVLVPIKSTGDIVLDKPLYELGITGIFTRNLDVAMLNGEIDIAVHSFKDVPTVLPEGIRQASVLRRDDYSDVLIIKGTEEFFGEKNGIIATGSLRRKAMWLNRYPTHTVVGLRGNVNTRLEKLENNDWNGAIFAAAGLYRLGKKPADAINLSWMIPAPAQGAIMITCLEEDADSFGACQQLNHKETEICTSIERAFLNLLEGGCTAPIGAVAYIDAKTEEVNFKAVLLKKDGSKKITVAKTAKLDSCEFLAKDCADYVINRGGKELMQEDEENTTKVASVYATKKLSELQKETLSPAIGIKDSDFIKMRFNRISVKVMKNQHENVVITSQNGVEAILNSFTKNEINFKNIFCVGRRTKKLIESRIGKVTHVSKNALKLAEYIAKETDIKNVSYFCSDVRLDVLPTYLQANDIVVNEVEAYKTMVNPIKIDDEVSGVLFFSPSGIESYLEENTTDKVAFCIGETTAVTARKHFDKVEVANMPDVESVLELVNTYYSEN